MNTYIEIDNNSTINSLLVERLCRVNFEKKEIVEV